MTILLENICVLALDCQTTGAGPANGHLLEIGWLRTSASAGSGQFESGVQAWMVELPEGATIPPRVQQVTGISVGDMETAIPPDTVWNKLEKSARQTALAQGLNTCPTVIHYAKFETPFLRRMRESVDPDPDYPLQIICTHGIARRLLPDLPRLGLRAIAGYFGHSVPEKRRVTDHVLATAVVWRVMVGMLKNAGIDTQEDLFRWLDDTEGPGRRGRVYPMDPKIRRSIHDRPGVYRMLRSNGDVLYVGKAVSLKKRVNSYFHKGRRHAEHILEMLTQAADLDVTTTESALQAAILESDEIKRLVPPYNIALRENGRQLGFCSPDFKDPSLTADENRCVGPLPTIDALQPLAVMVELLGRPDNRTNTIEDRYDDLLPAIFRENRPDVEMLSRGLDILRRRHGEMLNRSDMPKAVLRLGATLWRCRREEQEVARSAVDENVEPGEDGRRETEAMAWTPETVASALAAIVRNSAHRVRQGRWFCLLSVSVLIWKSRSLSLPKRHFVAFDRGRCRYAATVGHHEDIPPPGGWNTPLNHRLKCFDVAAYDRMRVVSTEIRRLVAEGREVSLCLSPTVCLDSDKLAKLLAWV